uniref:Phospholipid phosphatase 1-like isoform X1 n=1 Tax=Crassostrea virginica TaxID=6565 RepID=A0A8B8DUA9_CRAVI|nr:phospholipid phosphatase 1-like isoform X1 [Crassostrea virginica]XP_022331221.1 phospholipid phosphatase 1-like isoform X1 [Crassostrea virginica]XP_022331222.1 phospholipid phosphatase 1-like isoform X1 [Crassostrea virginica]XP_022331223.1 phospholipid phosphatase 1-like isoform X1 [Crassostrea virginica]
MESTCSDEMKSTRRRGRIVQYIVQIGFYIILATFDYLLSLNKIDFFYPFRRGFFCQDKELSYPFRETTIEGGYVALISILPTVIIIGVTEFVRIRHKFTIKPYVRVCYGIIGALLLGLSCCTLFYEVTKSCVGSLRPYFFAVCRPTLDVTNCTDTHRYMYITDNDCATSNRDQLIDARKSFPSGHASISWYGMTFLVIYIHLRVSSHWRKLRPYCALLQTVALCVATFIGVSRIQDNAHRSVDIFAGAVIGIVFASITVQTKDVSLTSAISVEKKAGKVAKKDNRESLNVTLQSSVQ